MGAWGAQLAGRVLFFWLWLWLWLWLCVGPASAADLVPQAESGGLERIGLLAIAGVFLGTVWCGVMGRWVSALLCGALAVGIAMWLELWWVLFIFLAPLVPLFLFLHLQMRVERVWCDDDSRDSDDQGGASGR